MFRSKEIIKVHSSYPCMVLFIEKHEDRKNWGFLLLRIALQDTFLLLTDVSRYLQLSLLSIEIWTIEKKCRDICFCRDYVVFLHMLRFPKTFLINLYFGIIDYFEHWIIILLRKGESESHISLHRGRVLVPTWSCEA